MYKKIDLTGQRFGRLVVIREVQTVGNNRAYLCRCDCGNQRMVSMNQLRSGRARSCGCLNRERSSEKNTHDLTGQRFGRLTVIGRSERRHQTQHHAFWKCRCDCGNEIDVLSKYLVSGETKSCGCWKIDHGRALQQLDNEKFRIDGTYIPALRSRLRSDNKTGFKGVSKNSQTGKFRATLTFKGKHIYLGEYLRLEDAVAARRIGEDKYFKLYLEKSYG